MTNIVAVHIFIQYGGDLATPGGNAASTLLSECEIKSNNNTTQRKIRFSYGYELSFSGNCLCYDFATASPGRTTVKAATEQIARCF